MVLKLIQGNNKLKFTTAETPKLVINASSVNSGASNIYWGLITGTLSNQTDLWTVLSGKQDSLGYTPENVTNKVTSISGSSTDTQYPSAKLLYDQLSAKVPYTGATSNVNLGVYKLTTESIFLNTTPTVSVTQGQMYWDNNDKTLAVDLDSSVTLQVGQEQHVRAVNKTGAQINDGQVVYISGAQGNRPKISLARADSYTTSCVIGVATENIADNAEGYVTVNGIVRGFNTSTFLDGDTLYLSPSTAGVLTNTPPISPNNVVVVAIALNSTNNGSIYVHPHRPLDADVTLSDNTDLVAPTQKAVKTYADTKQTAYTNLSTIGGLANSIGWLYNNGSGTFSYSTPSASDVGAEVPLTFSTGLNRSTNTITLSHLGIQNLTDPNANVLMGWDDTDGATKWITLGTNLTYDHSTHTLNATGGSGGGDVTGDSSSTDNAITRFNGTTGKVIQNSLVTVDDNGGIAVPDTNTAIFYKGSTRFLYNFDVPATYGKNLFLGRGAGNLSMTTIGNAYDASHDVGIGDASLASLTTGYNNTAIGYATLQNATESNWRTAVGDRALQTATTGQDDVGIGAQALAALTTGMNNTCVGTTALKFLITGVGNTSLGWWSGRGDLGVYDISNESSYIDDYCLFLGYLATRDGSIDYNTKLTNASSIGYRAKVSTSNTMVLGGTGSYAIKLALNHHTAVDGTFTMKDRNLLVTAEATPAGTASNVTIKPTGVYFYASDGDAGDISYNTSDTMLFENAAKYTFDNTVQVGTGSADKSITFRSSTSWNYNFLSSSDDFKINDAQSQDFLSLNYNGGTTGKNLSLMNGLMVVKLDKTITLADQTNFVFNATTGTKIGTATTQKLAFYNSTPIVQPTGSIFTALGNLGLVGSPTAALDELSDVTITTPTTDQVLKYNGAEWVNGSAVTSSGAIGIEFFMDDTAIIATSTNNANEVNTLTKIPVTSTAEVVDAIACNNNTVFGEAYLYNTALGRTQLDGGLWKFNTYASVSSTSAGRVSSITRNIYTVEIGTGTVTTTGTGTSRTCTASSGTPFVSGDASATNTLAGYVQTPQGLYQITAFTSSTVVTIATPSTYVNESAVTYNKWKRQFGSTTGTITNLTTNYGLYQHETAQGTISINTTDKFAEIVFCTSNNTTTVNFTHNGTAHYSNFQTPLITMHNNLAGLQGGTSGEYYHLTSAQYTVATQAATGSINGYLSSTDWTTFNGKQSALTNSAGLASAINDETGTGVVVFNNSPTFVDDITVGTQGSATGSILMKGTTSGTVTIKTADAAGTWTLTLPTTDGDANQVLQTDGSGVTSWATPASGGATILKAYKSADQSKTNNTYADDTHLTTTVEANANYIVRVVFYVSQGSATPNIKAQFVAPSGTTDIYGISQNTDSTPQISTISGIAGALNLGFSAPIIGDNMCTFDGSLSTGANAGTLKIQWAQNTTNASATTVKRGSYMTLIKV